jgi:hypothetical protein
MKARLIRFADSPDGVFGFLILRDDQGKEVARFATIEDDWQNNAPSVSCIPDGTYTCKPSKWHAKGDVDVFQITGVPHRDRILIHYGNTEEDVKGCVVVGKDFSALQVRDEDRPGNPVRNKWCVIDSRIAFKELMALLAGVESFSLTIVWGQPGEWRSL